MADDSGRRGRDLLAAGIDEYGPRILMGGGCLLGIATARGLNTLVDLASYVARHRLVAGIAAVLTISAVVFVLVAGHRAPSRFAAINGVVVVTAAAVLCILWGVAVSVAYLALTARHDPFANTALQYVPPAPAPIGRYVALGDSYSSGEGVSPYEPTSVTGTGDDCHRSTRAYSELVTFTPADVSRTFHACSGARVGQVRDYPQQTNRGRTTYPPQTEGVLGSDVGLVTLTIGGNDMHFSDVVTFCLLKPRCLDLPFTVADPGPDEARMPSRQPLRKWAQAMLRIVGGRVEHLLAELRADAPNARIIVLGYPALFPTGDTSGGNLKCTSVLSRIDARERKGLMSVEDRLNEMLYSIGAEAEVEFVAVSDIFGFGGACGISSEIAGVNLSRAARRGSFHPTVVGQSQMARQLSCYLRSYRTPRDPHNRLTLPGDPPGTGFPYGLKGVPGTFFEPLPDCPEGPR
jgi:hypothetical protein